MSPLRLFAPLAALAFCSFAAALDPAAWEFRQTITLDRSGPIRLTLPAETLDAARADLADLRLLGPGGAEIPFAIVHRNTVRPTTERIPSQARIEGRTTIVEFGLAQAQPIQRLLLETPAPEFTKAASVEIENGDNRWRPVLDSALVFRMRNRVEQLSLDLRGAHARSMRVTLDDDRSGPIPLTAVVVETGALDPESWIELPVEIASTESAAGTTRLALDLGLRHRAIAELSFDSRERTFQRGLRLVALNVEADEVVERELATGSIARMELSPEHRGAHLTLPVDATTPAARLELLVDDGDSPPLTDLRIVAHLRRVDIGFDAPAAGTYTLLAGAAHSSAPRYDVAAFGADWGRLPSTDSHAAARTSNPAYRPAQMPIDVPEFGGPIDTTKWSQHRDVHLAAPGAQVLELDPAALARSRADLGDLRLVREGRQVPYLLERTPRARTADVALVAAPDSARPTVGRWEIALPVEGMPVTSLRLSINETVFARTVIVSERRTDSRGQPYTTALGHAAIQRHATGDPSVFSIPLQGRPSGDTLSIEIDHGDNAAFAPVKATVVYPVRRLHFRATETSGCSLFYGNPTASAPRYDLQLAAPRLLAAIQHPAELAPTSESRRSGAGFSIGGPATRFAFWGALTVVVGVLIWLVARLLPKPPAAG